MYIINEDITVPTILNTGQHSTIYEDNFFVNGMILRSGGSPLQRGVSFDSIIPWIPNIGDRF